MPEKSELLTQLDNLTIWSRGSQRAPHKPLLLLLVLASIQRGESRLQLYVEIEEKLKRLLVEFGPPRKSYHPEYPFWRLQNDGEFWEIPERPELLQAISDRKRSGDIPPSILRQHNTSGGFTTEVYELLRKNPQLVNEISARLLQAHFPTSLHETILDAVGMLWVVPRNRRPARDPGFREAIIRIYEHRCAICGFDGRLGMSDLGLEAAHVMWHAAGGPDTEDNGLALCVMHHQLLDRGALGISENHRILVSQHVHGGPQVHAYITRFIGQNLRPPQPGARAPAAKYIRWHRKEVFREPLRIDVES